MKIFLIGFMCSGKSTTVRKLAREFGYTPFDLDKYIEEQQGASIVDIFRYEGEAKFREYESAALRELCSKDESMVIATGGGTPCSVGNMELMNSVGVTVYLKHSARQLAVRLSVSKNKRPLVKSMDFEELEKFTEEKLSQREKYYSQAEIIYNNPTRDISGLIAKIKIYI